VIFFKEFLQEAIAAVRTVTSLNAQSPIGAMYNENVAAATGAAIRKNAVSGLGLGLLNTFIYCGYSLTFYYSYQLIQEHLISAGTVVNVFFAILIGSFALGQIAPEMQVRHF
jgi:ATP-binding cassette, subfamily B (MDR/TAP), member 1